MIKNYFTIALRNLLKQWFYSIVNILGLSIGIAVVCIAIPISYRVMNYWLANFAYRINTGMGIFLIVGLAALPVAWATVSFQSLKAAGTNPARSLRSE